MFQSNENPMFRSSFAEGIFNHKYAHEGCETWAALVYTMVQDVCGGLMTDDEIGELEHIIANLKFIPGGRYLYYAGKKKKFYNNCFLLSSLEDTREDWAELSWKAELCLTTGGGIGNDYSVYRERGAPLASTGGVASGPCAKMEMVNNQGRGIMQGGDRRAAIYASLLHSHPDIAEFMVMKNWYDMKVAGTKETYGSLKEADFNFNAPMDYTNTSVNYDTGWLLNLWETGESGETFRKNCEQALRTGEPGFSFNFFGKENETLRNACTEVTSCDDSDVCNLGSINFGRIDNIMELRTVVELATKFLICGSMRSELPYPKVHMVRNKNRRLGLGLMGIHEWLIKKGQKYDIRGELKRWLSVYEAVSNSTGDAFANKHSVSRPVAKRAVAPTGTIGILAGTTTGIEPLYAVAYKRRYLKGKTWKHQYVVDSAAQEMIDLYGVDPEKIETSIDLAKDFERRIKFQAEVQRFVDMGISSTINIPKWGTEHNNEDTVNKFAKVLATNAHRLRGFTCYPDGARGGQPLTSVPYSEAVGKAGEEFDDIVQAHDICDISGHGGTCGI